MEAYYSFLSLHEMHVGSSKNARYFRSFSYVTTIYGLNLLYDVDD